MDFNAAIFDLDGTILDSMDVWEHSINAQGYFNRDPERDAFYLISYQTCRRINVTWPSPYPEVKAFVKEATRVVYDQDKICWNGAPLSSVKSFHRDTAC